MTFLSSRTLVTADARVSGMRGARNRVYIARCLEGTAEVQAAATLADQEANSGVFQSAAWLAAVFSELAPVHQAEAVAVEVRTAAGDLALLLPLLATREAGLDVLRVPSLGVCDYGGPILGPAAPDNERAARELWQSVTVALGGYDLIIIENMPLTIGGRSNPLASVAAARPADHQRHALTLASTVEEMLRGRGKKYRKEAERCTRLLAERGAPAFKRAESWQDIAHGYAILQEQQAARRSEAGDGYVLDQPEYARFYETLVRQGTAAGTAHLFTLAAGAEVGACLLGVTHAGVFTLLRISTAGGPWKRISPGRLIVLEAMRYFLPRGVRTFDMGIGDYPFKQGFGIEPEPLATLEASLSLKGWPRFMRHRLRAAARRNARLRTLVRRIKGAAAPQAA